MFTVSTLVVIAALLYIGGRILDPHRPVFVELGRELNKHGSLYSVIFGLLVFGFITVMQGSPLEVMLDSLSGTGRTPLYINLICVTIMAAVLASTSMSWFKED
jgi:hypothetical protein